MHFRTLPALALALLLAACNRELEVPEPDSGLYPIVEGRERVYAVTAKRFELSSNPLLPIDTLTQTYRKRELTTTTEVDLLGRTVHRLEVWTSGTDSLGAPLPWEYDQLWTQWKDTEFAERIEGNVRYQVLRFPVSPGKSWNANAYNALGEMQIAYVNTDTTVVLNGQSYAGCTHVQWLVFNGLTEESEVYEVYAPGIGKIERYEKRYFYEQKNNQRSFLTDSYFFHETLLSHTYAP